MSKIDDALWTEFAAKDDDEKDQSMIYNLSSGARCSEIPEASDRMALRGTSTTSEWTVTPKYPRGYTDFCYN